MSTYVCSDIHGRYDRFIKLVETINFTDKDDMYILGDVIDRNDGGINILKYILDHPNIHLIMGNHECMMLDVLDSATNGYIDYFDFPWFIPCNGGSVTYQCYQQEPFDIQQKIYNLLSNAPYLVTLTINNQKFHLSHSGTFYDETRTIYENNSWYFTDLTFDEIKILTWYSTYTVRDYIPETYYPDDYLSINGHIRVQDLSDTFEIYKHPDANILTIDGGCGGGELDETTALIGLRLDDMEVFYIH